MKKLLGCLTVLAMTTGLATAGQPQIGLYRGAEVVVDEVLLTVDEAVRPGDLMDLVERESLELRRVRLDNGLALSSKEFMTSAASARPTRVVVLGFDPAQASMDDVLSRVRDYPGVLVAEPNHIRWATATPNDPRFGSQWGLTKIGCPTAYDITLGEPRIIAAIVDTGVDYNHEDVPVNYRADLGRDTVNNDFDPKDDHGHGTHVMGTVAEATNNGKGGAGVAPGVSIMGVKVLAGNGSGTDEQVAAGIDWARTKGAHVVNMSLGGSDPNTTLENAVKAAFAAGVFLACATGNDSGAIGYPAKYEGCTAVGATNSNNGKAYFSNYGPEIDIAAPGTGILSMYKGGYSNLDGTSMATPHVAGVAALAFSVASSGTTGTAVRAKLLSTAQDLGSTGWDQNFGAGLVRADRAVAP